MVERETALTRHGIACDTVSGSIPMAIGDTVGATIRRLREARGLSQEALARKAGLARLTVIRIETGSQSPTLDSLERVAKALGVRLRALIPDN